MVFFSKREVMQDFSKHFLFNCLNQVVKLYLKNMWADWNTTKNYLIIVLFSLILLFNYCRNAGNHKLYIYDCPDTIIYDVILCYSSKISIISLIFLSFHILTFSHPCLCTIVYIHLHCKFIYYVFTWIQGQA